MEAIKNSFCCLFCGLQWKHAKTLEIFDFENNELKFQKRMRSFDGIFKFRELSYTFRTTLSSLFTPAQI